MSSPSTIDRFLRDHADGRYFARLANAPAPHAQRETPTLVHHATLNALEPRFTIVTPTFDCAGHIEAYINATAGAASLPFDWILVDDGSVDGTAERARAILTSRPLPLAARVTILHNPAPIFETACDNIGFTLAETDVIIEIQSDIHVREAAFDALMIDALARTPQPATVSGRCGHSYLALRGRLARAVFGRGRTDGVGLCGTAIDTPDAIEPLRGQLFCCETVPRGPWAVRKADLERHGYLDERHFFLGNDDHDYHRRLYAAEGRRPLYAPMSLHAPLHLGARRQARTGVNARIFAELSREKRGSPGFRAFLAAQRQSAAPERII
jgi:GT2 family glycosyltransferase